MRIVFKHFPLSPMRPSFKAAEAAVYAHRNGKFWEMHELIYKNSRQLSVEKLKEMGRQIGLDEAGLLEALSSESVKSAVDKDVVDGRRAEVTGTPTIFVNGKRVQRRDLATIKRMVDEVLQAGGKQGAEAASARR